MLSRWLGLVSAGWSVMVAAGCPAREPIGSTGEARSACAWDDPAAPDRVVLVTVAGRDVVAVRGDGTSRTVVRLGTDEAAGTSATVETRDGFALVRAGWWDETGTRAVLETALVDRDGAVRWHRTEAPTVLEPFLGQAGLVAVGDYLTGGTLVRPDGSTESYGPFVPMAGPFADGTVAARRQSWGAAIVGWAEPGATELRSLAYAESGDFPIAFAGELVYLALDGDQRIVVRESPTDVRVIPLPILPEEAYACALGPPNAAGWLTVHDWTQPLVAVDLVNGRADRLAITIPEGMRRFNATGFQMPGIDEDGALLLALRDDTAGGMYRSLDGGATWDRLGASVGGVLAVEADGRAGTYAILATNARYAEEEWPAEPSADLTGDALQIVRPEDGVLETLPAPFEAWTWGTVERQLLSEDGDCAAYFEDGEAGPRLSVLRVSTGERTRIASPVNLDAPRATAWLTSASR